MSETAKTAGFLLFGALLAGAAWWVNAATQPNPETVDLTGQPFFENFTSAADATALKVSAVDPEDGELQSFRVEEKNGLWRIPSHHDYPAEAAERLATTATSVLGIRRESRASSNSAEHAKYGVLDPESFDPASADQNKLEDYGKRITLRDGADEVLADFIIGRQADLEVDEVFRGSFEQEVGQQLYYVRRADEDKTYVVKLNIDLSTRFADWIDPDLLQVDASQVREIEIDNYELKPRNGGLMGGLQPVTRVQMDQLLILRDGPSNPWRLEGFDEQTELLVNNRIDEIVNVVDELEIVGVRPKLTYQGKQLITADLQINPIEELTQDPAFFQQLMNRLQDEMAANGFNFVNDEGIKLVAQFGEVRVGTAEGAVYQLLFGSRVAGDERAIEIGTVASADDGEGSDSTVADDESGEEQGAGDAVGEGDGEETDGEDAPADNRYLMIRVLFDPELLGPAPTPPTEPQPPIPPEGYVPAPADNQQSGEEEKGEDETGEATETEGGEESGVERDPAFVEYERQLQEYEERKTEFELEKTRYEDQLERYQERVAQGERRVEELNQRFGQWYYVISASNLEVLQSQRDDLVQPKAVDPATDTPPLPDRPDISLELPDEMDEPPAKPEGGDPSEADASGDEEGDGDGDGAVVGEAGTEGTGAEGSGTEGSGTEGSGTEGSGTEGSDGTGDREAG